jgi:aminoglycoside phosphotransferase (APT) family kinase protein
LNAPFLKIPGSAQWTGLQAIHAGWSDDRKYEFTLNGQPYLLRISNVSLYERRKKEFEALHAMSDLTIAVTSPVSFGFCDDGKSCFTIMTWVDGEDASKILPTLKEEEQYRLGYNAGRILKQIHSIPAPLDRQSWSVFYNHKIDRKLDAYKNCGIFVRHANQIIIFIHDHRAFLSDRPQTLQHGDYHCGNMVITDEKEVGVIDFDRMDYGDPWEEFNRITWCAGVSSAFASGRINGYFEDQVPEQFFILMALYIATNMLASIPWAIAYGQGEIDVMIREIERTMKAYDNFQTIVPKWYRPE